jgi:microcystin-dependent protein
MSVMVGEIKLWSGENIPAGWLACDGRTLNVVEYLPLYTVLGNLYGGNSTTFVLPDLRDRTVRGLNPVTQLLGSTTGSDYVTISNNNLPQHNHTATFTNTTSSSGTANVAIPVDSSTSGNDIPTSEMSLGKAFLGSNPVKIYSTGSTTTTLKPFNASVSLPTITGDISVNNAGQSNPTPITVTPPSILLHYIIAAVGVLPTY